MTNERKLGFRDGARWAAFWLHKHAGTMNDPHAKAILNTAAYQMGVESKDVRVVISDSLPLERLESAHAS